MGAWGIDLCVSIIEIVSLQVYSTILKKEVMFLLENIGRVVTLFVRW